MSSRDFRSEPFNNSFARALESYRPRTGVKAHSEPRASSKRGPRGSTAASVPSEGDEFLQAVQDTVPLSTEQGRVAPSYKPRLRRRRPPDDLASLVAAQPFDLCFSDRFLRARSAGVSRDTLRRLERGEFSVCAHVDLHGMALEDARHAVDEFLLSCQRRSQRCVLVITGKGRNSPGGQAVLREGIPQWLCRGPSARRVLAFVTARRCDGGEGAMYVLLRKRASRKNRIYVESGGGI